MKTFKEICEEIAKEHRYESWAKMQRTLHPASMKEYEHMAAAFYAASALEAVKDGYTVDQVKLKIRTELYVPINVAPE